MSTWIPVVAALLAAFAALTVPRVTFQLALRQEQIKWHRDQRAQLYVDLLVEAHAEKQHMDYLIARKELEDQHDVGTGWYTDLRLPPAERARLGARVAMFASRAVQRQFGTMMGVGGRATLGFRLFEPTDLHVKIKMAEALEALEQVIRAEMRTDDRRITPCPGHSGVRRPLWRTTG